jgi:hypothetical protein
MLLKEVIVYKNDPFVDPLVCKFLRTIKEKSTCKEKTQYIPSFTREQNSIINKYHNVIFSKLRHPDAYFFYWVEELPDKTYMFKLLPVEQLQSCIASIGSLDNEVWFVLNESGEIISSNEHKHPFRKEVFE